MNSQVPKHIDPALIHNEQRLTEFLAWLGFQSQPIPLEQNATRMFRAGAFSGPARYLPAQEPGRARLDAPAVVTVQDGALCIYYYEAGDGLFHRWKKLGGRPQIETLRETIRSAMNTDEIAVLRERNTNLVVRAFGLLIFLLGVLAAYFFLLVPLLRALQGEGSISYSRQVAGAAPMAFMLGTLLMVFGADGMRALAARPIRPLAALWLVVTLVLCVICFYGMQYLFARLGYF